MAKPKYQTREYRAARASYTRAQAQGQWLTCAQPVCVMDSRAIPPTHPIDVAHDDTGTLILGPAHQRCNRADGGRRRHTTTAPRRWDL
jgi:hypothetical protein